MDTTEKIQAFLWQSDTENNCNTYLIDGPTKILIDPGHAAFFSHVEEELFKLKIDLNDIGLVLCTHVHPDHFEATQFFQQLPARLAIHQEEWEFIRSMEKYLKSTFGINIDDIAPDFFIQEGNLCVHDTEFNIYHTPGHSPGSVSIYWPETKALFTGDVIFKEAIGRTDLPGGKTSELKESIQRLAALDTNLFFPGHGDIISGSDEIKANFDEILQVWFR